jgi:hypothetical protein
MPVNANAAKDKSDSGPETSDENRRGKRRRTLKKGKIMLTDTTVLDCVVRDLSEGGACVTFGGPTQLPDSFWLVLLPEQRMRLADLLWQRGLNAGISFSGDERAAPSRV